MNLHPLNGNHDAVTFLTFHDVARDAGVRPLSAAMLAQFRLLTEVPVASIQHSRSCPCICQEDSLLRR